MTWLPELLLAVKMELCSDDVRGALPLGEVMRKAVC